MKGPYADKDKFEQTRTFLENKPYFCSTEQKKANSIIKYR